MSRIETVPAQAADVRRSARRPHHARALIVFVGIPTIVALVIVAILGTAGIPSLTAGSRADAEHYYGTDPTALALATAVTAGDHDRIVELVEAGADPDAVGTDYITMAQWAIESGSPDGLEALLEAGALRDRLGRAGRAPLHDAARQSDPRYARILLTAGADPDVRVAYSDTTALREACLAAHAATFEALVAGGADVEARDRAGDRALHICARAGTGALVLRLLELGADPTARNVAGNTFQDYYFSFDDSLLSWAAHRQHLQTAAWLQEHRVPLVPRAERYR
ncbi:hypothetical protein MLP_47410 [Microlunatus phosphovorus NM-1]|uniref:Uncharacterized protein n=1 Tax=Microlunatus phosphovorus (strain ATCC 700054 / DSM 10555 / JCM 9379 / NBRC 101784 / NCIMB 13414 / VKM Ac-1990 / NM-1) TaxID=1032480 RepID=F5XF17_MICPN|nr:hypothetical protein MLP_47410 [Microlunatus phosphovorus NM-1]